MLGVAHGAAVTGHGVAQEAVAEVDGPAVGDDVIDDRVEGVGLDGLEVVLHVEAVGLAFLGGHVANIHLEGRGLPHRVGYAVHKQIGEHAGVEAAGAEHDYVAMANGLHRAQGGAGIHRLDQ